MVDNMEFQERIYDLVNGYLDVEKFPVPESEFVKNEFVRGSALLFCTCGACYNIFGDIP